MSRQFERNDAPSIARKEPAGRERYPLKALRGDFAAIGEGDDRRRARLAAAAVRA